MPLILINNIEIEAPNIFGASYGVAATKDLKDFTISEDEEKDLFSRGRSSEKRIKNFSLGRLAAKRALEQLGRGDVISIRKGERGEPLWPDNIKGSIAHTDEAGIAICTEDAEIKGIGIDFESAERKLDFDIGSYIATVAEQQWIQQGEVSCRALKIFCLKEAVYKAFSPIVGRFIGFQEVEFIFEEEVIKEVLLSDSLPKLYKIEMHLEANQSWIIAVCILKNG